MSWTREQQREYERARYRKLKSQGLCIKCTKPHNRGTTRCLSCKEKDTAQQRKRRGHKPMQCYICLGKGHHPDYCPLMEN